jgi:head-tail adaptor
MRRPASASVLRERIGLDKPDIVPDGYGGQENGWTAQGNRPAQFLHQRGNEGFEAAQLSGRSVYKVRVRQSPMTRNIEAGWRVRDLTRGTIYNVISVDAISDRAFVYMTCESGVAV